MCTAYCTRALGAPAPARRTQQSDGGEREGACILLEGPAAANNSEEHRKNETQTQEKDNREDPGNGDGGAEEMGEGADRTRRRNSE